MNQPTTPTAQPFVGHTFRIQYGPAMTVLNAYAEDGRTMRYEVTEGEYAGATAEVQYTAVELAPGLFALSWQEADKGTVVHIDNFAAGHRARSTPRPNWAFCAWKAAWRKCADIGKPRH